VAASIADTQVDMALTTPPPQVQALSDQLISAAVGFASEAASVWYPVKPDFAGVTFPICVIADMGPRATPYAEGAAPLMGGRLRVIIYSDVGVGSLETLGRATLLALLSQYLGLPFRASDCGIASDPKPGKIAGGAAIFALALDLAYGLEP
jgi:hypothetical protein